MFLQIAFSVWLAFANSESPIIALDIKRQFNKAVSSYFFYVNCLYFYFRGVLNVTVSNRLNARQSEIFTEFIECTTKILFTIA